jgi:hypothetical protein
LTTIRKAIVKIHNKTAGEKLQLTDKTIASELDNLAVKKQELEELVQRSFLARELKNDYISLMNERYQRILN